MVKKQNCVIWIQTLYTLFIVYIKTDDIYKDVAKDAETRFDTNCELNRPLSKGKIRKELN